MSSDTTRIATVMEAFEAISRSLRKCAEPDWMDLDLTMAQLKTLFTLEYGGPSTIGQTGEKLGISLPTASHLVDRLVHGGYVERTEDPDDRRRTLASTTASGSELVNRLRHGGHDVLRGWLETLDDATLSALVTGLNGLMALACEPSVIAPNELADVVEAR